MTSFSDVRRHRIGHMATAWRAMYSSWAERDGFSPSAHDLATVACEFAADDTPTDAELNGLAAMITALQQRGDHTDEIAPLAYDYIKELIT